MKLKTGQHISVVNRKGRYSYLGIDRSMSQLLPDLVGLWIFCEWDEPGASGHWKISEARNVYVLQCLVTKTLKIPIVPSTVGDVQRLHLIPYRATHCGTFLLLSHPPRPAAPRRSCLTRKIFGRLFCCGEDFWQSSEHCHKLLESQWNSAFSSRHHCCCRKEDRNPRLSARARA